MNDPNAWLVNMTPADRGILIACRPEFAALINALKLPYTPPSIPVVKP